MEPARIIKVRVIGKVTVIGIRNEAIQRVTKAKFLGIIVDQHLNWKDHISMVSLKISISCGIISRIRSTLDIKSKKMIYYSLIHPYLTYCIDV